VSQDDIEAVTTFLTQTLARGQQMDADTLIARAAEQGFSASQVMWALWNLVGQGKATVTDDSRVTAAA